MLKTLRFQIFVFFETNTLLDMSLRALQTPTRVSKSTTMDSNVILDCIH